MIKTKSTLSSAAAVVLLALSLSGAAVAQSGTTDAAGDGGGMGAKGSAADMADSTGSTAAHKSTTKHHAMKHKSTKASVTKDPNDTHMMGAHQGGAAATTGRDSLSGGSVGSSGN